jgi:hypothetical protein
MISIDPQFWIIRGGKDHFKYGDPFSFSVTAVKISEEAVEFRGLNGKISLADAKEIKKQFEAMGFKKGIWERKKNAMDN